MSRWRRRPFRQRNGETLLRDGPSIPAEQLARFRDAQSAEERYSRTGEISALEEAIDAYESLLRDPRIRDLGWFASAVTTNAGAAHFRLYQTRGDIEELEHSLMIYRWGLASGAADASLALNLAVALHERHERTGSIDDLDEAVEALSAAIAEVPPQSSALPRLLTNLSSSLNTRYLRLGSRADLDQAVVASTHAVSATAPGAPELAGRLTNLGNALSYRYWSDGSVDDLNRAIEAFGGAVAYTSPNSGELPRRLNNLANGLSYRYRREGSIDDSDDAINTFRHAVELTPDNSPDRPGRLSNLARELRARAARTGELEQLDEGIRLAREAVTIADADSPDTPVLISSVGDALLERYVWVGALVDLEHAIQLFREAVHRLPSDSAELRIPLAGLSNALQERFQRTRERADLSEAIAVARKALEQTPEDSPEGVSRLLTLGGVLISQFEVTREPSQLDAAVGVYEEAVERVSEGSPHRPGALSSFGTSLARRSIRMSDPIGCDKAVRLLREAVTLAPADSPQRLGFLMNLGLVLAEIGSDEAIEVLERIRMAAPEGSALLPTLLANLGFILDKRHARTGSARDLDAAITAYERTWALVQAEHAGAPIVYQLGRQDEAARVTTPLVEALLVRAELGGTTRADRRRALEVAEAGKSRLLADMLARGDLPAPAAVSQAEKAREQSLLEELAALDRLELAFAGGPVPESIGPANDQDARLARLRRREQLRAELEALWDGFAAAGVDGEKYVAVRRGEALDWTGLASLAVEVGADTPLASLFMCARRTLLFILRVGWDEPRVVDLPLKAAAWEKIGQAVARDIARGRSARELARPREIGRHQEWAASLRPLLAGAAPFLEGAERIVLAPHGPGHAVPWAAVALDAKLRTPQGEPLPLVVVPALALMPRLRRRPRPRESDALIIGNPTGDLPFAETEAEMVGAALHATPLVGKSATKAAVRSRLRHAHHVHFASHAFFEPGAPLASGVVLSDGVLTAREILEERLRAERLVLSACESGIAGTLGGDELAGLAHSFLHAGARSLLVSLWEVSDPATATLMESFYLATARGIDAAAALAAAQTELRARPDYADPYYWAAFVLMGNWT